MKFIQGLDFEEFSANRKLLFASKKEPDKKMDLSKLDPSQIQGLGPTFGPLVQLLRGDKYAWAIFVL